MKVMTEDYCIESLPSPLWISPGMSSCWKIGHLQNEGRQKRREIELYWRHWSVTWQFLRDSPPSGTTRTFHGEYGWSVVPMFQIKGSTKCSQTKRGVPFIPPPSPVRHLHVRKTKKVQLNFIYNLSHLASIDLSNNWQNIDVIFFLVRITNPKWVLFIIFSCNSWCTDDEAISPLQYLSTGGSRAFGKSSGACYFS